MSTFEVRKARSGFAMKLSRGERTCLLGFDVDNPEEDFVGFAIECKEPDATDFIPLRNRIAFSYPPGTTVTGDRQFPSTEAPFQKFRWLHFPRDVRTGIYTYRATKMHMPRDNVLKKGRTLTAAISLDPVTYAGFVDIGFTRNFASSQAFREKLGDPPDIDVVGRSIIPPNADDGLNFTKVPGDIYQWMGFEAYDLLFGFLDGVLGDSTLTLDVLAYDFSESDIFAKLKQLGNRLRIVIDDSVDQHGKGHGAADSAETRAATGLTDTAGAVNVKRTHFNGLQHNKVFIARRNGIACKVLGGSTNFSFRGLYIQANNLLLFDDADVAQLYGQMFDAAFTNPSGFTDLPLAKKWHLVQKTGMPLMHFCFSPHKLTELSLAPVQGAVQQASSSVFYAVAFLSQMGHGLTKDAFDALMTRPVFSYGISDKGGTLEVHKPDGSIGLVDFQYLAAHAPEPFKTEWGGGRGINIHHKFVVTDFNLPSAKVFTGSSNLSPTGEANNGDHLIMIEDRRIATAYAIEAVRIFDHLHFRSNMQAAQQPPAGGPPPPPIRLQKPKAISGATHNWFESSYIADSQKMKDRLLFSAA